MLIKPIKTRVFKADDNLIDFIYEYLPKLKENTIVVVTSKIVALAEGRVVKKVTSQAAMEKLVRLESQWAMKTKYTWLTIKDNMVMPRAGIDQSNADGMTILLPKDSFASADKIRQLLRIKYKLKKIGVLISDSRLLPLRGGVVGIALGYAGFRGLRNYRGQKDIFGRILKYSRTDVADSLATAAVLTMGEAAEQRPLAMIMDAPAEFIAKTNKHELDIDIKEDIYQPLFERIKKIKFKK